jgi:hypothetical protein
MGASILGALGFCFRRLARAIAACTASAALTAFVIATSSAAVLPGALPGSFSVGDQGDARYTIPIIVPEGAGGLRPDLALRYSHLAGDGLAGMRWTLSGIQAITRCQQTYAQDNQTSPVSYVSGAARFCLNGQRLVNISGTYGVSGAHYRTEVETFQRVIQTGGLIGGGPQSFYVDHGNGLRSYFGETWDSRVDSGPGGAVRIWYINRTVDRYNNEIRYLYDRDATTGETVPVEITWSHNSGLTPRYRVAINYSPRPTDDQRSGHDGGGAKWATTRRISQIDVFYNGSTLVSSYELSYRVPPSSGTGRSQLEKVTVRRGVDSLPETVFTLQDGNRGWGTLTSTGRSAGTHTLVGDWNGSGRQDVFVCLGGTWQVYPGLASGLFGTAVNSGVSCATNPEQARVIDYNGDGRADLLFRSGTSWNVLQSTGTGFTNTPTGLTTSNMQNPSVVDIDGDGLGDVVYMTFSLWTSMATAGGSGGACGGVRLLAPGPCALPEQLQPAALDCRRRSSVRRNTDHDAAGRCLPDTHAGARSRRRRSA